MEPPNPTSIDMRHTKLKASEAALLAGELVKPTWASRNEGIHERVSFEDTLWGFEMAGGAYYKTPLRVAYVRPGSRAEHACIRMGDTVLRINGQDTSSLTLQEAHKLVLEAGINLKIVVTSPEDKVNAHYDYEDPLIQEPQLTPEQLKALELERVRRALERASRCRDLPWPWVRRKWIIYRESNCFMVPSKYENKHKDKFPELPAQRLDYFFPVEKTDPAKNNSSKNDSKTLNETKIEEPLEEKEEEYEEVEEEVEIEDEAVEEGTVKEELTLLDNKVVDDENGVRLENETSENQDINEKNELKSNTEEISTSNLETEANELENTEATQRKDSNQSTSSFELDNNNNHVSKHKDEKTKEIRDNNQADDKIINEIIENSSGSLEGNLTKSDDDILDSVLNENVGGNSENER